VPASERSRELKRRRQRRAKITKLRKKAEKATGSDKAAIADKLRKLTPGAKVLIKDMGLED